MKENCRMWAKSSEKKKKVLKEIVVVVKRLEKGIRKRKCFNGNRKKTAYLRSILFSQPLLTPFPLPTFLKSRQASKQAANGQADVNSNVGGDLVKKTPSQQTAVKSN